MVQQEFLQKIVINGAIFFGGGLVIVVLGAFAWKGYKEHKKAKEDNKLFHHRGSNGKSHGRH